MSIPEIAPLLGEQGPFASVYLPARSDVADAVAQFDLRWKNARRELEGIGAGERTLQALDAAIDGFGRDLGGGDLAVVVASDEGIRFRAMFEDATRPEVAYWGPLPYVAPVIAFHQGEIPYVVAMVDREGADIASFVASDEVATKTVTGDAEHIQRSHPGGWSQRRFQQRAENTWERNAAGVADEVAAAADRVRARLVVASGDERALGFLQDHLPVRTRELLTSIPTGSRGDDRWAEALEAEVARLVATVAAADTRAMLERFAEERGQRDLAVDGVEETLAAISRGQVETLLVHDDPADERTAWFWSEAGQVAASATGLAGGDEAAATEGRLVDVALRGAFATGADVRIVPRHGRGAPEDGIGAMLRYPIA